MAISKWRKPIYRQTGGTTSIDPVTGQPILNVQPGKDALQEHVNTPAGAITTSTEPDQIIKDVLKDSTTYDPQYYGGDTVASLDPATIASFNTKIQAAKDRQGILADREAGYRKYLTPEYQQQAYDRGQSAGLTAAFGAGGRGSASAIQAATLGAEEAARKAYDSGLEGLSNVASELTQSGELERGVGQERRQYIQEKINEDIKKWNFTQLAPEQQRQRLIEYATALKAIQEGNVQSGGGGGGGGFNDILNTALTAVSTLQGNGFDPVEFFQSLFRAEGGPVYKAGGGMIYRQLGGGIGEMGMEGQGGIGSDPMMSEPTMAPPAAPMMPEPAPMSPTEGIAGADMGPEMGALEMEYEEPKSELDMVEDQLRAVAAASGGNIKITRKVKKGGSK